MAMRRPGAFAPLAAFYADDEKIMAAGEDAELLYVRMLAYAARTPRTEGWISDRVLVSRLGILPRPTEDGTGNVAGTDAGSRAGVLERVGLISRDGSGWRITSWLKWNRSCEEMSRERDRDRKRKTSSVDGTDAGTRAGTDAGTGAGFRGDRSDTDTETEEQLLPPTDVGAADGSRRRYTYPPDFTEFWHVYPIKKGKGAAAKAWAKAKRTDDTDDILDALRTAITSKGPLLGARAAEYVPHASTWLNERRWEDELDVPQAPSGPEPGSVWAQVPLTE